MQSQHLLQDFRSVSDHFETLCIKGLIEHITIFMMIMMAI